MFPICSTYLETVDTSSQPDVLGSFGVLMFDDLLVIVLILDLKCASPCFQFPCLCIKGKDLAISMPADDYLAGLQKCKHDLHGRVIWPNGLTLLKVDTLRSKLLIMWKSLNRRDLISFGRHYYEFSFSSLEDMRIFRSVTSWNLNLGFLNCLLGRMTSTPSLQQQTTSQVLICINGLSQ
ncbi:hypothetical protein L195_g016823 [Trifolium pratense]|uniref:DUF4283 domain-containing protein n=1 Tax=Trifolium pratense TaxID=57577 RepID=A0A2K3MS58_TRIPR|nr:hypothetical protein L195_g016823 [Trifolium pratense]